MSTRRPGALLLSLMAVACSGAEATDVAHSTAESGSTGAATTQASSSGADPQPTTAPTSESTGGGGSSGASVDSSSGPIDASSGSSSGHGTGDACDTGDEGTTGSPAPWACADVGNQLGLLVEGDWMGEADDVDVPRMGDCLIWFDGPDVAVQWSAPVDGWYRFTLASPGGRIALYDACDGAALQCRFGGGDFDDSVATAYLSAGESLAIVLHGPAANVPIPYSLSVEALPECSAATDVGDDLFAGVAGDVAGQGDELDVNCFVDQATGEDQSFAWIAPSTGIFTLSAEGPGFFGMAAAYRGHCGHQADMVACLAADHLPFLARSGEAYTLVVDTLAGSNEQFGLTMEAGPELAGDCCQPDASAGCEDADVTECVCALERGCCDPEQGWTALCAGLAATRCGSPCEPVRPGDCCEPHDAASCSAPDVAACACQLHFDCCAYPELSGPWGDFCVGVARDFCNADCCR